MYPPIGPRKGPPFTSNPREHIEVSIMGLQLRLKSLEDALDHFLNAAKTETESTYCSTRLKQSILFVTTVLNKCYEEQNVETQLATIIRFRETDGYHLIDYQGNRIWQNLRNLRFEECDTSLWKCGYISANLRTTHETDNCPFRPAQCKLGCGHKMEHRQVLFHMERRCNMRDCECRLGCGEVLKFQDLLEHEDTRCKLRLVGG